MAPTFEHLFTTPAVEVVPEASAQYRDKPEGSEDQGYRDES
ncbi:hypothetical protein ABZZ79_29305 [Streptomyces sp. NPDC006458]